MVKPLLRVSYLAPTIFESIFACTQQIDMAFASVNTITNIPLCWDEQQAMLAVGRLTRGRQSPMPLHQK